LPRHLQKPIKIHGLADVTVGTEIITFDFVLLILEWFNLFLRIFAYIREAFGFIQLFNELA